MLQIRKGVFETNSSSTHSLIIMSKDEWDKVEKGELFIDVFAVEKGTVSLINELTLYAEAKKEYEHQNIDEPDAEAWDEKIERLKLNYPKALKIKDINIFGFTGERYINPTSGVWKNHTVTELDDQKVQVEFNHFFG